MDLIPLGIGFGSGGITIGFLAKWIFVTKGELVAHEKEDRLRSDTSVQRVDDKLADIYKGISDLRVELANKYSRTRRADDKNE